MIYRRLSFTFENNKKTPMRLQCFHISDSQRSCSNYKSKAPQSREEFDSVTEFILGHFTSSSFLDKILKEGLLPDPHKERAIDDRVPSDSKSVYLASTYDWSYAERAVQHHKGKAIVIDVLVERQSVVADESSLSPNDLVTCDSDTALYHSLCLGACKHPGAIGLSSILSIAELDGTIIHKRQS